MVGNGRGVVRICAAAIAIAACGIQVAAAQAAITIGQSPPTSGTPTHCAIGQNFSDVFQNGSSSGNPYDIPPGGGVLTSWTARVTSGSLQQKLRVFSRTSSNSVTPTGESTAQTVTPTPETFPTRIPVQGGQILGLASKGDAGGCAYQTTSSFDVIGIGHGGGSLGKPETVTLQTGRLLNVSAVLEPDANGDGFGDETQKAPKCGGERATITSSRDDETVRGTRKDDVIVALGGDDVVRGLGGDDIICGRKGSDVLLGHAGSDLLIGEGGRDRLAGGAGADACNGGASRDRAGGCERGADR